MERQRALLPARRSQLRRSISPLALVGAGPGAGCSVCRFSGGLWPGAIGAAWPEARILSMSFMTDSSEGVDAAAMGAGGGTPTPMAGAGCITGCGAAAKGSKAAGPTVAGAGAGAAAGAGCAMDLMVGAGTAAMRSTSLASPSSFTLRRSSSGAPPGSTVARPSAGMGVPFSSASRVLMSASLTVSTLPRSSSESAPVMPASTSATMRGLHASRKPTTSLSTSSCAMPGDSGSRSRQSLIFSATTTRSASSLALASPAPPSASFSSPPSAASGAAAGATDGFGVKMGAAPSGSGAKRTPRCSRPW
mmetsp:Transcript_1987/g.5957  ORF Transcript_1987/g.5957 Transcript_1987/m.5957 type:complete len:305 (+) Transcript_1987:562-1476(+)